MIWINELACMTSGNNFFSSGLQLCSPVSLNVKYSTVFHTMEAGIRGESEQASSADMLKIDSYANLNSYTF